MRIGTIGPYTDHAPIEVRRRNTERADEAAKEIARRGHIPFCPHKMTFGWDDDETMKPWMWFNTDNEWLSLCDALLYLESSPNTDRELKTGKEQGKIIYYSIDEVPNLLVPLLDNLEEKLAQAYIIRFDDHDNFTQQDLTEVLREHPRLADALLQVPDAAREYLGDTVRYRLGLESEYEWVGRRLSVYFVRDKRGWDDGSQLWFEKMNAFRLGWWKDNILPIPLKPDLETDFTIDLYHMVEDFAE